MLRALELLRACVRWMREEVKLTPLGSRGWQRRNSVFGLFSLFWGLGGKYGLILSFLRQHLLSRLFYSLPHDLTALVPLPPSDGIQFLPHSQGPGSYLWSNPHRGELSPGDGSAFLSCLLIFGALFLDFHSCTHLTFGLLAVPWRDKSQLGAGD